MADIVTRRQQAMSPFARLQDEMNELFGRFWDWPLSERQMGAGIWMPTLDVSDRADSFIVKAELPGLKGEDIDISVSGNVMTLSGEKREETEKTEGGWLHRERRYGSFRRDISLPSTVDVDKIKADFKDGVLTVTLPKTEKAKPKHIEVK